MTWFSCFGRRYRSRLIGPNAFLFLWAIAIGTSFFAAQRWHALHKPKEAGRHEVVAGPAATRPTAGTAGHRLTGLDAAMHSKPVSTALMRPGSLGTPFQHGLEGTPLWFRRLPADPSGRFRIHSNAFPRNSGQALDGLVLCTQLTPEHAPELVESSSSFDGPVSAAVLVTHSLPWALALIQRLRECSRSFREHVSIHLVLVNSEPLYADSQFSGVSELMAGMDCAGLLSGQPVHADGGSASERDYARGFPYPNNFLRNVAREQGALIRAAAEEAVCFPCRAVLSS